MWSSNIGIPFALVFEDGGWPVVSSMAMLRCFNATFGEQLVRYRHSRW